jgi:hypothetical protein
MDPFESDPLARGEGGGCGCRLGAAAPGLNAGDVLIAMGIFVMAAWRFLKPKG